MLVGESQAKHWMKLASGTILKEALKKQTPINSFCILFKFVVSEFAILGVILSIRHWVLNSSFVVTVLF